MKFLNTYPWHGSFINKNNTNLMSITNFQYIRATDFKNKAYTFLSAIVLLVSSFNLNAQTEEHTVSIHNDKSIHSISFVMANAFMPNSFADETNDMLIVPVFGLNYDYQINGHWGLGFHSDILLQQFKIEKHGSEEELIRENPIALCAMVFYKPNHHWKILAGYGMEFEKHENLKIIRAGLEYGIELPKNWELAFLLEFDYKINTYWSIVPGIGFSKRF